MGPFFTLGLDWLNRADLMPADRTSPRLTVVGRVPLPVRMSPHNLRYLRTKRDRMGHDLPDLDEGGGADAGTGTSVVDSAGS